jgi:hypothetical protein
MLFNTSNWPAPLSYPPSSVNASSAPSPAASSANLTIVMQGLPMPVGPSDGSTYTPVHAPLADGPGADFFNGTNATAWRLPRLDLSYMQVRHTFCPLSLGSA